MRLNCTLRPAFRSSPGWQAAVALTITIMPRADSSGGLHRGAAFNAADAVSTTELVCGELVFGVLVYGVDHRPSQLATRSCRIQNDLCGVPRGSSAIRVRAASRVPQHSRSVSATFCRSRRLMSGQLLPSVCGRTIRSSPHGNRSEQPVRVAAYVIFQTAESRGPLPRLSLFPAQVRSASIRFRTAADNYSMLRVCITL